MQLDPLFVLFAVPVAFSIGLSSLIVWQENKEDRQFKKMKHSKP